MSSSRETAMGRARPNEGGGMYAPRPPSDRLPPPAASTYAPVSSPPAGWYRDPGGVHQYRFWNGWGWTPGVANGPEVGQDLGAAPAVPWATPEPETPATPPRAPPAVGSPAV